MRTSWLLVALALMGCGSDSTSSLVMEVVSPGGDLQTAIDSVCMQGGGTVKLKTGVHAISYSLKLTCSDLTLTGEDRATTIIDGTTALAETTARPACDASMLPPVIPPLIHMGPPVAPCAVPPGGPLENIRMSNLTIKRDDPKGDPSIGFSPTWCNHCAVVDVNVQGFLAGMESLRSDDLLVSGTEVTGRPNMAAGAGLVFADNSYGPSGEWKDVLVVKPHTTGGTLRDNVIRDTASGIIARNADNIDVHDNTFTARATGLVLGFRAVGGAGHSVHNNKFILNTDPTSLGFQLYNPQGADVHDNTVCLAPTGVRYEATGTLYMNAVSFGYPTASNNNIRNNLFAGATQGDAQGIVFANATAVGPGNTATGNVVGAQEACP